MNYNDLIPEIGMRYWKMGTFLHPGEKILIKSYNGWFIQYTKSKDPNYIYVMSWITFILFCYKTYDNEDVQDL